MNTGAGVYAVLWVSQCSRCQCFIPAGTMRAWVAIATPLCADCVVALGMGDVEGLVAAMARLDSVRLPYPADRAALARVTHAAGEYAAARLEATASAVAQDDETEGESTMLGDHELARMTTRVILWVADRLESNGGVEMITLLATPAEGVLDDLGPEFNALSNDDQWRVLVVATFWAASLLTLQTPRSFTEQVAYPDGRPS